MKKEQIVYKVEPVGDFPIKYISPCFRLKSEAKDYIKNIKKREKGFQLWWIIKKYIVEEIDPTTHDDNPCESNESPTDLQKFYKSLKNL